MEEVNPRATDFNPERCPYTWTPELGNGVCYGEVRCTERADNAGHAHVWTQADQDKWTAQTKATVIAALAEGLDVPEAVMTATGGWTSPTQYLTEMADLAFDLPEFRVSRGVPEFGATVPRVKPEPVPVDPRGHWEYGVDVSEEGEEPEIVSGEGSYYGEFTRFTSAQEAHDYGGGTVYKRWVPAAGPWDEVH